MPNPSIISASPPPTPAPFPQLGKALAAFGIVLVLCFAVPLYRLARFALASDLYSHILLVPLITAYLIRINRDRLELEVQPRRWLALPPFLAGLLVLAGYEIAVQRGWAPRINDYLFLMMLAFLCFLAGGAFFFLGKTTLQRVFFPLAFLGFMLPFPTPARDWLETFLQFRSADAADLFFGLSGMTYLRTINQFELRGITLEVARECSGIHSSLVLFITSLLAAYLFLKSPWKRAAIALAVIPLAILRNGFRIWVLGELCVRMGPQMIDSPIHRRGGPFFFALSLIPFFLLLYFLRRSETRRP